MKCTRARSRVSGAALGKLNGAWIVASETCAFDLLGQPTSRHRTARCCASIKRHRVARFAAEKTSAAVHFRARLFRAPGQPRFRPLVEQSRECWAACWRETPRSADIVVPVPDRRPAALGYAQESGYPPHGIDPESLRGAHLHRAQQAIRDFGVKLKLNPVADCFRETVVLVDDSIVRGTTSARSCTCARSRRTEVHMRISCPPTIRHAITA